MRDDSPLLRLEHLEVSYGAVPALRGVDLALFRGETACLIGANGAGKTTTLKAIAGLLTPTAGTISFAGQSIGHLPPHQRVRRGIALVPEGRGILGRLTVEENLRLGAYSRTDPHAVREDMDRVFELLPRMRERLQQLAGTLSGGEQQMLAIGRALLARPTLLLLDEPSMGLAPLMVDKVFELVEAVAKAGVTLLLVEQNAHLALDLADRAWVMESGRITLSGSGAELAADPRVRTAYLGEIQTDAANGL